ncbi:S1 family peptidase [Bradyrhizobium sp. DASA03120]|uniref:S1 family peptidase n=1 Tax=Bradyrhizobium sp. SMVTL-02 TaxID=3395917 RepID=UPI003F71BDAB
MRGRADHLLFVSFLLCATTLHAGAACIDPAQLAHSTVRIMRHFNDAERDARPNLIGVGGTGWFLSPTTIVTAEHVTAGMKLSTEEWKSLDIVDAENSHSIAARIQRVAGVRAEKITVIELEHAVTAARSVAIRKKPLVPDEQVMTLTYLAGLLHPVGGRFVRFGDDGKLAGMALLEFYEGENRLVIDHGASGAPVIDCDGRVAAVISNVFTQSIVWASHQLRISTAWGMPNVVSVPVEVLDEFAQSN